MQRSILVDEEVRLVHAWHSMEEGWYLIRMKVGTYSRAVATGPVAQF